MNFKKHCPAVWLMVLLYVGMTAVLAEQLIDSEMNVGDPVITNRLVRPPPVRIEPVIVATGNYITGHCSRVIGSVDMATYAVANITNGHLASTVDVMFDGSTTPADFPTLAILVLVPSSGSDSIAGVPGNAAWRGIIPYTSEKWDEIMSSGLQGLGRNEINHQIPLSDAINRVEQYWLTKGVPPELIQSGKYDAIRTGFSWMIQTLKPTENPNVFIPAGLHEVTDDNLIGIIYSPASLAIVSTNGEVYYKQ